MHLPSRIRRCRTTVRDPASAVPFGEPSNVWSSQFKQDFGASYLEQDIQSLMGPSFLWTTLELDWGSKFQISKERLKMHASQNMQIAARMACQKSILIPWLSAIQDINYESRCTLHGLPCAFKWLFPQSHCCVLHIADKAVCEPKGKACLNRNWQPNNKWGSSTFAFSPCPFQWAWYYLYRPDVRAMESARATIQFCVKAYSPSDEACHFRCPWWWLDDWLGNAQISLFVAWRTMKRTRFLAIRIRYSYQIPFCLYPSSKTSLQELPRSVIEED